MEHRGNTPIKKRLDSRWLWWGLLALTLVAAVGYLKITQLAPLGGDDQVNNLYKYYQLTHGGAWEMFLDELQSIWKALTLQNDRFFPFSSLPVSVQIWFRGTIDSYRLFIIGHTLVDAALLALLVNKATGNKRLGGALFALTPLMFCLWNDCAINGMYSYGALPQQVLLPVILAGLCMVALHNTGHRRWAVLGAFFVFYGCGTYEIGYSYILMLGFLALLLEPRFKQAVRLGLPFLAGELVALFYHVASSFLNTAEGDAVGASVSIQSTFDPSKFLHTWLCQMSGGFPLNNLFFADVKVQQILVRDVIWALLLAAACVLFLLLGKPSLTKRQGVCLFFMGLMMLAGPAFMVSLSTKYQNNGWVSLTSSYIPATAESFGVAILLLVVLTVLFQLARQGRHGKVLVAVLSVVTLAGLTACGTFQQAATREHYAGSRDTYDLMVDGVKAGLVDEVPEDAPLVCTLNVWGGNKGAEEWFFLRYGDLQRNAYYEESWKKAPQSGNDQIYFLSSDCSVGEYDVAWLAEVTDETTDYADSVKIYIQGDQVPEDAELNYVTQCTDGTEISKEVCIADLPRVESNINGDYFVVVQDNRILTDQISLCA